MTETIYSGTNSKYTKEHSPPKPQKTVISSPNLERSGSKVNTRGYPTTCNECRNCIEFPLKCTKCSELFCMGCFKYHMEDGERQCRRLNKYRSGGVKSINSSIMYNKSEKSVNRERIIYNIGALGSRNPGTILGRAAARSQGATPRARGSGIGSGRGSPPGGYNYNNNYNYNYNNNNNHKSTYQYNPHKNLEFQTGSPKFSKDNSRESIGLSVSMSPFLSVNTRTLGTSPATRSILTSNYVTPTGEQDLDNRGVIYPKQSNLLYASSPALPSPRFPTHQILTVNTNQEKGTSFHTLNEDLHLGKWPPPQEYIPKGNNIYIKKSANTNTTPKKLKENLKNAVNILTTSDSKSTDTVLSCCDRCGEKYNGDLTEHEIICESNRTTITQGLHYETETSFTPAMINNNYDSSSINNNIEDTKYENTNNSMKCTFNSCFFQGTPNDMQAHWKLCNLYIYIQYIQYT